MVEAFWIEEECFCWIQTSPGRRHGFSDFVPWFFGLVGEIPAGRSTPASPSAGSAAVPANAPTRRNLPRP